MKAIIILLFYNFLFLNSISCELTSSHRNNYPAFPQVKKDSCDDPDANINCLFLQAPVLSNTMTIADDSVIGEKLYISGIIYKSDGKTPYPDLILYAYHTDHKGHYPKNGKETGVHKWHGYLHGWCKTDSNGFYLLATIRPAPYPNNKIPAHIHAAIKKPDGNSPFYITDFVFKDDPLINQAYISSLPNLAGGTGIVELSKVNEMTWVGQRDLILRD